MKSKIIAVVCALLGFAATAATTAMPRSEWHLLVGDAAQDPAKLRATISQLTPDDQRAFLGEVNEAIAKLPGSNESRAATFLLANRAALLGSSKSNRLALLGEVYATVPPEYLTVISEEFGSTLFSAKNPRGRRFGFIEYERIATNAMNQIVKRLDGVENAGPRATLAAAMFVRGWGTADQGLMDALILQLPKDIQKVARQEWLPSALGVAPPTTELGAAVAKTGESKETTVSDVGKTGENKDATDTKADGQQQAADGQQGQQQAADGQQGQVDQQAIANDTGSGAQTQEIGTGNYDSLLDAAQAGEAPSADGTRAAVAEQTGEQGENRGDVDGGGHDQVVSAGGIQTIDALMGDLQAESSVDMQKPVTQIGGSAPGGSSGPAAPASTPGGGNAGSTTGGAPVVPRDYILNPVNPDTGGENPYYNGGSGSGGGGGGGGGGMYSGQD